MPDIALRPRSPTELVDAAFQLYRGDPLPFITGLALIYVPWLVIVAVTGILPRVAGTAASPDGSVALMDMRPLLYWAFGSVVIYVLGAAVTTVLASERYFGRPSDLRDAAIQVAVAFPAMMVATVITATLGTVGLFFFVLPGLYLFARFFATSQAILLEHAGVFGSIARSWRLTRGQVRHVINTMGLVVLLTYAILIGAGLVGSMLPGMMLRVLVSTIASCIAYPMVGIVATLLYYDIRIRREGFDIEYLAAASGPAAESSAAP